MFVFQPEIIDIAVPIFKDTCHTSISDVLRSFYIISASYYEPTKIT